MLLAPCNVSLFLETAPSTLASNGSLPIYNSHIFLPFHGGSDDRACLRLLVQLVTANPNLSATVLHVVRAPEPTSADLALSNTTSFVDEKAQHTSSSSNQDNGMFTVHGGANATDTLYPTLARGAGNGIESEAQDDVLLSRYFSPPSTSESEPSRTKEVEEALKRISYEKVSTAQPIQTVLSRISTLSNSSPNRPLVVLVGRSRLDAPSHSAEINQLLKVHTEKVQRSICVSTEVRRALGDQATACVVEGSASRVWVVQTKGKGGRVRDDI